MTGSTRRHVPNAVLTCQAASETRNVRRRMGEMPVEPLRQRVQDL
jgi:hypothetical protein